MRHQVNSKAAGSRNNGQDVINVGVRVAAILQNIVLQNPDQGIQNGGGHDGDVNNVPVPYHGYQPQQDTVEPPVLHIPEDNPLNLLGEYPVNVGRLEDLIELEDMLGITTGAPAGDAPTQTSKNTRSDDDDYDSDFVEPRPKSQNHKKPKCTPASSDRPGGEGTMAMAVADAGPSTSYGVAPIDLPPQANAAPMLRAALIAKRRSRAGTSKETIEQKSASTQKAKRRVVNNRRKVQKKVATVAAEQVPIQRPADSDSESEFDIFSQSDDRDLFKNCFKRYRRMDKEYRVLEEKVQAAENTKNTAESNLRDVDADIQRVEEERERLRRELQRADEEHQRLVDRRNRITESVARADQIIGERRGDLDKTEKKVKFLKKKFFKK